MSEDEDLYYYKGHLMTKEEIESYLEDKYKNHNCLISDSLCSCIHREGALWQIHPDGTKYKVNYCPACGIGSKMKISKDYLDFFKIRYKSIDQAYAEIERRHRFSFLEKWFVFSTILNLSTCILRALNIYW